MTEQHHVPRYELTDSGYRLITNAKARIPGAGSAVNNAREWSFPAEDVLEILIGQKPLDLSKNPAWKIKDGLEAYRLLDDGHPLKQQYSLETIMDTYENHVKPQLD